MNRAKLINRAVPVWLAAYTGLTLAASSTFAQDVKGYDFESLMFSAAAGLLGGALRTILSMATDSKVVLNILKEFWKDAIVALIAGLVAYVVIQGVNSTSYFTVPRDLRMLLITAAGWMRLSFFGRLDKLAGEAVNAVHNKIRGNGPAPAEPTSASVPLGKD